MPELTLGVEPDRRELGVMFVFEQGVDKRSLEFALATLRGGEEVVGVDPNFPPCIFRDDNGIFEAGKALLLWLDRVEHDFVGPGFVRKSNDKKLVCDVAPLESNALLGIQNYGSGTSNSPAAYMDLRHSRRDCLRHANSQQIILKAIEPRLDRGGDSSQQWQQR